MSNQNPNLRSEVIRSEATVTRSEAIKDIRVLCDHLFDPTPTKPAHRCASPALRGETFCYYHHPTRRHLRETRSAWRIARRNFSVPTPTNREQLLDILSCVLQAIADNRVKIPHARRILYGLQQVGISLEKVDSPSSTASRPRPSIATTSHPAGFWGTDTG
jgi:hypothetical protein